MLLMMMKSKTKRKELLRRKTMKQTRKKMKKKKQTKRRTKKRRKKKTKRKLKRRGQCVIEREVVGQCCSVEVRRLLTTALSLSMNVVQVDSFVFAFLFGQR